MIFSEQTKSFSEFLNKNSISAGIISFLSVVLAFTQELTLRTKYPSIGGFLYLITGLLFVVFIYEIHQKIVGEQKRGRGINWLLVTLLLFIILLVIPLLTMLVISVLTMITPSTTLKISDATDSLMLKEFSSAIRQLLIVMWNVLFGFLIFGFLHLIASRLKNTHSPPPPVLILFGALFFLLLIFWIFVYLLMPKDINFLIAVNQTTTALLVFFWKEKLLHSKWNKR